MNDNRIQQSQQNRPSFQWNKIPDPCPNEYKQTKGFLKDMLGGPTTVVGLIISVLGLIVYVISFIFGGRRR